MPSRPLPFRPRFTLMLVYLAAFFLIYALLLVAPELASVASDAGSLPPEELQARAHEAAQQAMRGKAVIALVLALATVGLGTWRRFLPGMR
jgi:hypothetical protein